MKFNFLTGDVNWKEYGGMFVSKKQNNGEFDYWLVIRVENLPEAMGRDAPAEYSVSLIAVSPEQAKDHLDAALGCCGIESNENDPMVQVEALASYGIFAPVWEETGNNLNKLMKEAHKQADLSSMLFGFYMDAPKNRIGNTGWDCIAGHIGL